MAIQTIEQSEEQTTKDNSQKQELANSIKASVAGNSMTSKILEDLGLSPEKPKEEIKKEKEPVEREEELEEGEAETSEDDEGLEAEEVIPKSKVQKRFDAMTAQLKAQQAELEELKNSRSESKDATTKQLEAMTEEQLKATKLEIRKAQIKASGDDAKLDELIALEDKVDGVLKDMPAKFQRSQEVELKKMAQKIEANNDFTADDGNKILKLAAELYNDYPVLQKDIKGQATALEMAAKHYKTMATLPKAEKGDKSKESDLTRQVNTLKRKTMLDTKTSKGNTDQVALDKLKKDAIGGTLKQKINLIKTHPAFNIAGMIPDEFKS